MDGVWLARARWRRRGAWMWPAFLITTVLDGVIGHLVPAAGDSQKLLAAALGGCFLNLLGIVLLSRPLGALLRRRRRDLPRLIAQDYGGTIASCAITVTLLIVGLVHHSAVAAHQATRGDAVTRAQAFIGDRAPEEFRRHLSVVDTYAIEPGAMYRICIPSDRRVRSYCVIVKTRLPFEQSVSFDGYETNDVFAAGAG